MLYTCLDIGAGAERQGRWLPRHEHDGGQRPIAVLLQLPQRPMNALDGRLAQCVHRRVAEADHPNGDALVAQWQQLHLRTGCWVGALRMNCGVEQLCGNRRSIVGYGVGGTGRHAPTADMMVVVYRRDRIAALPLPRRSSRWPLEVANARRRSRAAAAAAVARARGGAGAGEEVLEAFNDAGDPRRRPAPCPSLAWPMWRMWMCMACVGRILVE